MLLSAEVRGVREVIGGWFFSFGFVVGNALLRHRGGIKDR